jgi:ABC-type nitrate/sulfonate/bicarbonate transport system permease component
VKVLGDVAVRWSLLVLLVVLWQLGASAAHSLFFPPPSEIVAHIRALWLSGPADHLFLTRAVGKDIVPSLERTFLGWSIAVVAGIVAGVAIGRSRALSQFVNPTLQFIRSTPGPALVPVFLLLLGTGSTMRVALIAFGSVWPVLLNTIDGVRSVDAVQLDTARAFSLPPLARLRHIVVPAALPRIFAGMRVAIALSLILMVVSELVASTDGIGHAISDAQHAFLLPDMWAGIVLIGFLGYALNAIFVAVEHRVLFWHRGARQREPR